MAFPALWWDLHESPPTYGNLKATQFFLAFQTTYAGSHPRKQNALPHPSPVSLSVTLHPTHLLNLFHTLGCRCVHIFSKHYCLNSANSLTDLLQRSPPFFLPLYTCTCTKASSLFFSLLSQKKKKCLQTYPNRSASLTASSLFPS